MFKFKKWNDTKLAVPLRDDGSGFLKSSSSNRASSSTSSMSSSNMSDDDNFQICATLSFTFAGSMKKKTYFVKMFFSL